MKKQNTDMQILIHDIVKSKGYGVWKNWSNKDLGKKTSVQNLADSINNKINKKPIIEEPKIEKAVRESLEQLTFQF